MRTEFILILFKKIFGDQIPKDKNFNVEVFLQEFNTYMLAPITGRSSIFYERDLFHVYSKFKKALESLSCNIEHDEFHKVYHCVFKFTKYKKVYQELKLTLRYDSSYITDFYYSEKMRKYVRNITSVSLVHLFMKSNNYCHVIQEFGVRYINRSEPEFRYFMIKGEPYESILNQEFNNSVLLIFFNYDQSFNLKKIDYFCIGKYNFSLTYCDGVYSEKTYIFTDDSKNITKNLVIYLNDSGFDLLDLNHNDLLLCDAYTY